MSETTPSDAPGPATDPADPRNPGRSGAPSRQQEEADAAAAATKAEAPAEETALVFDPSLKGDLPDDFPGKAALETAGITTYGGVRTQASKAEGLTAIAGIGAATAAKIEDALARPAEPPA